MSEERTEGYVIRPRRIDDLISYEAPFSDYVSSLEKARVFSLAELNERISGKNFYGTIVRVRRVEGLQTYKVMLASDLKAMGIALRQNATVRPDLWMICDVSVVQIIPAASRWEVVEE